MNHKLKGGSLTLREIKYKLALNTRTAKKHLNEEVTGGYSSDLLSDVMANAKKGNIWITIQSHPNIVAVASLLELSAIIVTGGKKIEKETLSRAEREDITIFDTTESTFNIVGKLYKMGVIGG